MNLSAGTLVARDAQLAGLSAYLDRARDADGLICFVSGEGGAGKTTLVTQFTELAQAEDQQLVVATGQCDARSGVGDAYLPFREILHALTGNLDGTLAEGRITDTNAGRLRRLKDVSAEAVVNLGPSLLGLLIPGGALLANMGKFVVSRSSMADRLHLGTEAALGAETLDEGQIFEQYLKVLRRVSESAPLLLVLDDLQWADPASIGLLFRLGRRLQGSRILVVGIYRPSDVRLGRGGDRHPLEPVVNEMKRYFGDIEVNLDVERPEDGQAFVDDYLDGQANRLGPDFRAELHRHTGGHPLFTVELLRSLQERGQLARDPDGAWTVAGTLDWSMVPSRVEGVVEERLSRLPEDLRRALTVAAVEGETFTAEVVAQVQRTELRGLVRELSETVQKRHRLVRALGVERVDGHRISRYSFAHQTMQHYLVSTLDSVEASFLHEDIARALEELYAAAPEQVAVQLAHHYDRAELGERALHFLKVAGDRARRVSANAEAVQHYRRALHWASADEERYPLLERLVDLNRQLGDIDARGAALGELEDLVASSSRPAWRAEAWLQRAVYEDDTGHYPAAREAAQRAATQFLEIGDPEGEARALIKLAAVDNQTARYDEARVSLRRVLQITTAAGLLDLKGQAYTSLGIAEDLSGRGESALAFFTRAHQARRDGGSPESLVWSLSNLGVGQWRNHQFEAARHTLEEGLAAARRLGLRPAEGIISANLGLVLKDLRDLPRAGTAIEAALAINRDLRNPYAIARCLGLLGRVVCQQGSYDAARAAWQEALELDREAGDQQDAAFQLTALAELALITGSYEESAAFHDQAVEVAQRAGAKDAHTDCLLGLSALRIVTGRPADALDVLSQAQQLAHELGDETRVAQTTLLGGHAHSALDDRAAARDLYQRALDSQDPVVGAEARVALALEELCEGMEEKASELVIPVAHRILRGDTTGVVDLFWVLGATVQVLTMLRDPLRADVLRLGQELLATHATGLEGAAQRQRFLEHVRRIAPALTR